MTLSSRHQSNVSPAGSYDGDVSLEPEQSGPSVPQSLSYMAVTGKNTAMPFHFTGGGESIAMKSLGLDSQQVHCEKYIRKSIYL